MTDLPDAVVTNRIRSSSSSWRSLAAASRSRNSVLEPEALQLDAGPQHGSRTLRRAGVTAAATAAVELAGGDDRVRP